MSQTATPETVLLPLSEIRPYEGNPRINEAAIEPLIISIQQFGFLVPLVVDKDGVIITGHTRYEASKRLKLEEVPVIFATHLDDAQVRAFRLADNRLAQNSTWDEDLLQQELVHIQNMGFNLQFTGFSKEELDCLTEPVAASCLDELDYATVCGAIEEEAAKPNLSVIISVGTYRVRVDAKQFLDWEENMLKTFPNKSSIQREIITRLGFDLTEEQQQSFENAEAKEAKAAAKAAEKEAEQEQETDLDQDA